MIFHDQMTLFWVVVFLKKKWRLSVTVVSYLNEAIGNTNTKIFQTSTESATTLQPWSNLMETMVNDRKDFGHISVCKWRVDALCLKLLIALVVWCRGNHIHRANCENTSFRSSAERLKGTCLPLLLCWFNNSKQVFAASRAKAHPPPFIALRDGETYKALTDSTVVSLHFDLHVALWLTMIVLLQVQMYHVKCPSIKWNIIYQTLPRFAEHMAHHKRSFIRRDFVLWINCSQKTEQSQSLAALVTGSSRSGRGGCWFKMSLSISPPC